MSHPILDSRLRTRWRPGPAAAAKGPLLVSYTEFTPHTLRDLPAIYRAAKRLCDACTELDGAVGAAVYWQLFRRRGGSLSVWEDEAALQSFISFPFHVEIMRRYRTRGSLRAFDWREDRIDLAAAFRDGQAALDRGIG